MKKIPAIIGISIVFAMLLFSCKTTNQQMTPTPVAGFFIKGADVGWITEMEAAGKKFYDTAGHQQNLIELLKSYGINTIRLRVWVNPANGWNGAADVLAKALRAKAAGMNLLLDFHYSDSWADPGQQQKPAAWQTANFTTLTDSLKQHTLYVLNYLKNNGITPGWVQVGNETNNGMLWPDGKASENIKNFADLIRTGYTAVKTVFPSAKVIVHISNGWDNNLFRWMFDGLKNNGANWDVIGMSLYPDASNWQALNAQCLTNMNDMVNRYNKEVMITEVGMSWDQPVACHAFIKDLINKTQSVTDKKGTGILYWEPEAYNWKDYKLGCFDTTGKPTIALDAFR